MSRSLIALSLFLSFDAFGEPQPEVTIEKVSFAVESAFERGAAVSGELRIPAASPGRLPAVIIVNSTPGLDGRGAFYAEALNRAGIATLEIDPYQGKGMPVTLRHMMPHTFHTLRYLGEHPRIDKARIGIMGFSAGAIVAILASSEELARQYGAGVPRFGAHLALYPQCWYLRKDLRDDRFNGAPVHILGGDKDDYDDPDSCQRFVDQLPADTRPRFAVTTYRGATFAWDHRFGGSSYSGGANKGKGGFVNVIADPEIARQSREFAVNYFSDNLK